MDTTRPSSHPAPPVSQPQSNGAEANPTPGAGVAAPQESGKQQAVLIALGAPGGLAAAVIVWMTAFQIVRWTDFQTALVTAEAVAVIGFFGSLVGHLWPDSKEEPVALAATFTATLAATIALGNGFGWITWSQNQITAVLGVFTAFVGVGSALFARSRVHAGNTQRQSKSGATTGKSGATS